MLVTFRGQKASFHGLDLGVWIGLYLHHTNLCLPFPIRTVSEPAPTLSSIPCAFSLLVGKVGSF